MILVGAFIVLLSLHDPLGAPISDGFHDGELLASRMYFDRAGPVPVMIHGMMDVLPARLGMALFGEPWAGAATRLVNGLCTGLALVLLFVGLRIIGGRAAWLVPLLALSLLLLFCANHNSIPQQGAPAVRDLFLLAVVALLALAAMGPRRYQERLLGAAAFLAGATMFWAYNRGIAGVALVGAYAAALALAERSFRALGTAVAGGLAGVAAVYAVSPVMFAAHVSSILYWQAHQGIWHFATVGTRALAIAWACAVVLGLAALIALIGLAVARRGRRDARLPALTLGLAVAGLLVFASSLNRLEEVHAFMIVPYALLASAAAFAVWEGGRARGPLVLSRRAARVSGGIAGLAVFLQFCVSGEGLPANVRALTHGLESDRALADPAYLGVADMLRASGTRCTVALDNQAVVNHLAGVPPCSAFVVPIYAQGDAEPRMLAELQRAAPTMIVLGSDSPYYATDGIDQALRTPRIMAWARANYVPVANIGGIVVARARTR